MNSRVPVVIGLDIGTSSLKLVAFETGAATPHARETFAYDGEKERATSLGDYIRAVDNALDAVSQRCEIRAVAFTSQMYSLLTTSGHVVGWDTPWKMAPHLGTRFEEDFSGSGAQPDPIFPLFKIADVDEQHRRGMTLMPFGIKAALVEHYSGSRVIDMSEASATGMYNVRDGRWDSASEAWGIDPTALPDVIRHDEPVGPVRKTRGTRDRFVVVPGLGDGVSASVRGERLAGIAANLGTSVAARAILRQPILGRDGGEHRGASKGPDWTFRIDEERVVRGGISRAGFGMLAEARAKGFPVDDVSQVGSEPVFVPWISGAQWPLWDSGAASLLVGFTPRSSLESIGRAMRRSVAYMVAWMVESQVLSTQGVRCLVAGGGTRSAAFMDDLVGCAPVPLLLPEGAEFFAAEGAAVSAATAIGERIELPDVSTRTVAPTGALSEKFEEWKTVASRPQKTIRYEE